MNNYIVCDLETTGLDAQKDKIIEIAMIKVKDYQIVETYQTLINPGIKLPLRITRLTGITDLELEASPTINEVLPDIISFIDEIPMVGHNVEFDRSFLTCSIGHLPFSAYLDTYELTKILFPHLSDYSLSGLASQLNFNHQPCHRAMDDTIATVELLSALFARAGKLDSTVLKHLIVLLRAGNSPWFEVLEKLPANVTENDEPLFENHLAININPEVKRDSQIELPDRNIEYYLGKEGQLAKKLPNYKLRPGQVKMAKIITETLKEKKVCFIEAWTGTGKTIAYLLPTLLWAIKTKQQAVISTNTINLQEQIRHQDIPLLQNMLNIDTGFAFLKGRQNYLCLRRFFNIISSISINTYDPSAIIFFSRILIWLQDTKNGDKSELNVTGPENYYWLRVCSDAELCFGNSCTWQSSCFISRARQQAEISPVVITNHSLLFSDLVADVKILPSYNALVIDEAHHLEEAANIYLGKKISFIELNHWLLSVSKYFQNAYTKLLNFNNNELKKLLLAAYNAIKELQSAIKTFVQHFIGTSTEHFGHKTGIGITKVRLSQDSEIVQTTQADYFNLIFHLKSLKSQIKAIIDVFGFQPSPDQMLESFNHADLRIMLDKINTFQEDFSLIWESTPDNYVCWAEISEGSIHPEMNCIFYATPIEIGDLLNEKLFKKAKGIVFTSATLSVNQKFDHLIKQWGLESLPPNQLETVIVNSPFNFDQQCFLSVIENLPQYNAEEKLYTEAIAKAIYSLTERLGGRTLVLFTSHSMLKAIYNRTKPLFDHAGICLLGHKIDGGRTKLVREFKKGENNVLFGASSFWEGLDIPGNSLAQVIIVKLPFSPPNEPIMQAKMERLNQPEFNSFYELSLPRAVIRFKQGFGRLIRSEGDRGLVVVLDGRITSKKYGKVFLNSLPIKSYLSGELDAVIKKISGWLI
ncbi:helicase C-terminal domain-containing protein [Desulfotruncus alcoholivorax]|uniref:helicase C-terminal domain-containing protein n=1 Tax=Desulfotruncus alcoholivorax TaxID=265477 RepID=UPI000426F620|nr:helicase C-terminal domain-containing protein [Desulfotruncus alcoholivorax]